MVDAPDSKSGEGNLMWVRVPPPVLVLKALQTQGFCFYCRRGTRLSISPLVDNKAGRRSGKRANKRPESIASAASRCMLGRTWA